MMKTNSSKQTLFIGSYASSDAAGIYGGVFEVDTGNLTIHSSFTGIANPSFVLGHPNGRFLYSVSEIGMASDGQHGAVWAFRIGDDLTLDPINQQSTQGDWPCHLAIDGTGRWLIASNYGSGDAALFPLLPDGSLGPLQTLMRHQGSGPNKDRQEGPHAHSATFSPDNRFVIIADLGIDQLVVYAFDAEVGALVKQAEVQANPGAGPRHLAFGPNGRFLYAANELDNTVTVYRYDAANGSLSSIQTIPTLPAPNPDSAVADIHFSPSGQHLYVSNRGHNSVAVFGVGADGRLTSIGFPSCGGNWPRNFAVGGNGRYLLVANRHTNNIAILPLTAAGPNVQDPIQQTTISQPSCVQFI